MAKASIIIPVYNKEKYLRETLSSVDEQLEDDLEVILVDDASSDNSMDIITDFANSTKKKARIIQNDTNQGVAYSRNIGIEEAKSDYITFLDADDVLDKDFMEVMLNKAKKYPFVDFIRGNVCPFTEEEGYCTDGELEGFYDEQLILPVMMPNYIYEEINSSNGRLYKSDFVKNLRFIESSFEDYEFSLESMVSCTSILYTNKANYNYRVIPEGKNMTVLSNYLKSFCDYESIYDRVLEKYPNVFSSVRDKIRQKQLYLLLCYMQVINGSDIRAIDKESVIEYCLMYFKYKYQLAEEDIRMVIGKPILSTSGPGELKQRIKNILVKY